MKIKHLPFVLLVCFAGPLFSQSIKTNYGLPKAKEYDRVSAGVTFGFSHLLCDLLKGKQNNNRFLEQAEMKPAFGAQVHYQITHSIGLRARGMVSKFSAHDADYLDTLTLQPVAFGTSNHLSKTPINEVMDSKMFESSLEMTYNFGNISFLDRNKNFHMVATLGIGIFNFGATVREDSASSRLLRQSGNITELMIPASIGFKYKINKVDIGMAFEYRKSFTDNVDATIKTLSEYDNYLMLNVGVNYTFGNKNKPMEWVNPMEVVYNDLADMKEKIDILSGDKDKDGVSDLFDKDNNTPEGSKVYGDGTAVDTDGDGVIDSKDSDPFTAKGAKVDANGSETDTDSDGVADSRDLEPGTPQGSLVNFQGITLAKAGEFGKDGLSGSSSNGKNGIGYLPSIFFEIGNASVKSMYHDRILVIAKVMKANPELKITISGNCDLKGGDDENQKLGLRRADNVKKILVNEFGIDAARLSTDSKGEKDPMASKLNSMNRRVDFEVNQK